MCDVKYDEFMLFFVRHDSKLNILGYKTRCYKLRHYIIVYKCYISVIDRFDFCNKQLRIKKPLLVFLHLNPSTSLVQLSSV